MLYHIIACHSILHYITLHYITLHYITVYNIILCYIVLYYIILYHIILRKWQSTLSLCQHDLVQSNATAPTALRAVPFSPFPSFLTHAAPAGSRAPSGQSREGATGAA